MNRIQELCCSHLGNMCLLLRILLAFSLISQNHVSSESLVIFGLLVSRAFASTAEPTPERSITLPLCLGGPEEYVWTWACPLPARKFSVTLLRSLRFPSMCCTESGDSIELNSENLSRVSHRDPMFCILSLAVCKCRPCQQCKPHLL